MGVNRDKSQWVPQLDKPDDPDDPDDPEDPGAGDTTHMPPLCHPSGRCRVLRTWALGSDFCLLSRPC